MLSRINLFIIAGLIILTSACPAQDVSEQSVIKTARDADKVFPHIAEVIGTNVYIRSGPGTAYYFCGKISSPAKVTVVDQEHSWSKIIPPQGSFSWISKNYVHLDPKNELIGTVTGDSVRVWAGSGYVEPKNSHSLQTKLNEGDQVRLTGQEKGDYYMILPPPGAYLWINSEHINYTGPVPEPKPIILPPKPEPATPQDLKLVPELGPWAEFEPESDQAPLVPATEKPKTLEPPVILEPAVIKFPVEAKMLNECQELAKKIDAELEKNIDQQNYKDIIKSLTAIADNPQAGKAMFYARYHLDKAERFDLALTAKKQLKVQKATLAHLRQQIDERRSAKIKNIPDPGRFIVAGELRSSNIYTSRTGRKRFLIVNAAGKILCYAIPDESVADINAEDFLNRKVGLLGKVVSDPHNPVSLVTFTEIVELNDESGEE
jgi:uncharacterized protein YgiM (DUF1202 family)